jgi:hypothetical protein
MYCPPSPSRSQIIPSEASLSPPYCLATPTVQSAPPDRAAKTSIQLLLRPSHICGFFLYRSVLFGYYKSPDVQ